MGTKLGRAAAFGYPFYVTLVSLQPGGVAGTLAPMESWAPPEQAPRPLRGAESGPEQAEAGRGPSPLGSLKAAHYCEFPGDATHRGHPPSGGPHGTHLSPSFTSDDGPILLPAEK